ncbi:MAG TPA: rhodanese [Novosphingobium sp.]|nr:rhodanese [Novosphingobium sp.]
MADPVTRWLREWNAQMLSATLWAWWLPGLCAMAVLGGAPPFDAAPASAEPFDGEGYRNASYRAPVERDPAPAQRIALPAAMALHPGRDALFLDVLPAPGARRDPATGRWALTEPHDTIAGARWWPEAGRASPDRGLWRAFAAQVARFRRRHADAPVVVFCRADCWMSWNAARRLSLGGAGGVWWLAEGIEGWHAAGGRLVPAVPENAAATQNAPRSETGRAP